MSIPKDTEEVVLRSSDSVQFLVRKGLLSSASPVFSDMFLVPQPISNSDSDTPIDLAEHSRTLRFILDLCETYSSNPSLCIDLSDIVNLLQAADKYDIRIVQQQALYSLSLPKFLEKQPLRVYCIASRYGAYDIAALAARHLLRYPLLHAEYFSELKIVDGGTIYRVLHYHKQCTEAALRVAVDHSWIRVGRYAFMDCPGAEGVDSDDETRTTTIRTYPSRRYENGYPKSVFVHPWWSKFMAATKVALSGSINPETIRDQGRVKEALISAFQCSHCRRSVESDFGKFLDAFVSEVEARVKKIELVQPSAKSSLNWG